MINGDAKFAIEVKNVREKEFYETLIDGTYNNDEIVFLGNLRGALFGTLPNAEIKSLLLGLERRLRSPKDQAKIKEQIGNTVEFFNCKSTMLIISMETITNIVLSPYAIEQCLNQTLTKYPIVDYFSCFLSGNELFTYPKLLLEIP